MDVWGDMMFLNGDLDQSRAPLFEALQKYVSDDVIPFHVPGHKRGAGLEELTQYAGSRILEIDVNGMEDLDNICNPIGVIKESEALLAQLFDADDSFFLVNGTSQGVQSMLLNTCKPGDEIILPRNAHKSTIGALILSGAIPVYIQPEVNYDLGIAMGITVDSLQKAIRKHPYATGVFVINPTYYGATSDLMEIIRIAHQENMLVLADEAHGSHLKFHPDLPASAMELGADMSAISLHKTGGSMTQSSALLIKGERVNSAQMKTTLNLTQTTSASYVLMASIDLARKQLALHGQKIMKRVVDLVRYAREKINQIDGLYAFGSELIGTSGTFDFDETKLGIHVRKLGISGYEMETRLRREYNIQIEMSDFYNILAIVSIGDDQKNIDKLVEALQDIAYKQGVRKNLNITQVPYKPKLIVSPRDAYYSNKKSVRLEEAMGEISGEMIMAYPPGIPVICPGERITQEVIEYVQLLKLEKCQLQGTEDPYVDYVRVLGE